MRILVPTDFSECADFALEAAAQLAIQTSSELTLFHVGSIPEDFPGIADDSKLLEALKKRLQESVESLLTDRIQLLSARGVKVRGRFSYGDYLDAVLEEDKSNNYDLIVVGSYGASGKEEWFIGSNTQKLVRKVDKNVLVIKNPIEKLEFNRVLFPSNLTKEDEKAFRSFLEFIKIFNTKEVHVLAVNTSGWFKQPGPLMLELLEDFKAIAKDFECRTHFFADYSVEAGIRHFSEKYEIDMIGISNQVKRPIKRLFQGSNVEMLVNHSDLPVLAIYSQ